MKYRIELACEAYPLDKMWIDVKLDQKKFIDVTEEHFGTGAITYSGDARDYRFSLYEISEGVAGIDWEDKRFPAGELHILKKRVVKGSVHKFLDSRERSHYKVTKIIPFT
ncbi:hypothetical protein [Pantoea sp. ACRSB]|uniref:hypothetical protein n=1 Tax=Pantoea sp. ACRSB TaxID=2918207 RepID=UPI0028936D99|nr:hypothetical protein [Pantoea sp. ACRSB]MCG7388294.1 hypothetical protein [Pantoea sp. ACRSB]